MQKLQTVNAETLLYEPLEKPSFVVDSLIPTGLSLFCGSQKIGKSWLMLKLCLCVSQEIKIYYKFIGFVGELHITPTKRWTALKPKNCTVCGVEYVPRSGISKYCPACAKKIQREKSNESKRRSRERNRQACIELSAKNDRLIWSNVKEESTDICVMQ